jgi:2-keto-4-pentenoate hydratase/2-oxohepta-3-ene-1,7-dioic acid hydratase in catechol pathway
MKLVTYIYDGKASFGVLTDEEIRDIPSAWPDGPTSVVDALARGPAALIELDRRADIEAARRLRLDDVQLLAPIPNPPKLMGIAVNYVEHHREFDRGRDLPDDPANTTTPRPFLMPPTTVAATGEEIPWPTVSEEIDYEVELAVVIGREARNIEPLDADAIIAGYTIANDISARSMTHADGRSERPKDPFFDWLHGKWHDRFCPLGPCVVTAEEIPDPQQLHLTLSVNGETRQDALTNQMIFSVRELIAFCSRLMTLTPGDIIATGTPSGVGKATGKLLQPGDRIVGEIEGIGELINTMGPRPEQFYRPCRA